MATSELMAEEITSNSYEEARKLQLLENQKRFEELGIMKITKTLSDLSKSEKKSKQSEVKLKIRNTPITEPRRSTRERNPIVSYIDDVDIGLPSIKRSSKLNSSWASYLARPLEEVKIASYEERVKAMKSAEKLQSNLQSEFPSFVKSMVRSHVYSCFWLGLPMSFCKKHLPKSTVNMALEDEEGNEYECVFISQRTGMSGGWRAFALEHKLDDGDALVFELIEPKRFKIYIVKASHGGSVDHDDDGDSDDGDNDDGDGDVDDSDDGETKKRSRGRPKKQKVTVESPKENGKKSTVKNGGQTEKPKKSNEVVMGTRRSTRGVKK